MNNQVKIKSKSKYMDYVDISYIRTLHWLLNILCYSLFSNMQNVFKNSINVNFVIHIQLFSASQGFTCIAFRHTAMVIRYV